MESISRTVQTDMWPYETPLDFAEGYSRTIAAARRVNELRHGDEDPPCDIRDGETPVIGSDAEIAKASAKLQEGKDAHRRRVAATRAQGVRFPIDELVDLHQLDGKERQIVELMLAESIDLRIHTYPNRPTIGKLARTLANWDGQRAQDYLPCFLPQSRLRQGGLIVLSLNVGSLLRDYAVSLPAEVLDELLGGHAQAKTEKGRETIEESECELPTDIIRFLIESGVVLNSATAEQIQTLWGYVAHHEVVSETWGFDRLAQVSKCLCMLFYGPSGTGKTLTAQHLCQALNRKPLVVSYAQVLSKWVGDTEKNIHHIFEEASAHRKVIVFDEADAVLGRRGEISQAGDRHFNAEVNTLLMELDRFHGVVLLTTNNPQLLDPALERRIRYKVPFDPPDVQARVRIWRCHVPKEAPLARDVDLEKLAHRFELTGSQIANAVMSAASRAATRIANSEGHVCITTADLEAAARRELERYQSGKSKKGEFGFMHQSSRSQPKLGPTSSVQSGLCVGSDSDA